MNTYRIKPLAFVLVLATSACTKKEDPEASADTTTGCADTTTNCADTTSSNTSADQETTTSAPVPMESSSGQSESTAGDTGVPFDAGDPGDPIMCDILKEQDCPAGEKCMPWSNDGLDRWNATRCSPIDENPGQPGDECIVEGSAWSGIDSCDMDSMCYNVDPLTNMGICVTMCTGGEANLTCENPDDACAYFDPLAVCLPTCDPLSGCSLSQVCHPAGESWVCSREAEGEQGGYGDACEYFNVCDSGFVCASANLLPSGDCNDSNGCCTSLCDLTDPAGDAQCASGQECRPYPASANEPGYEDVGYCMVPR
jgi:hypothetical protein